LSKQATSLAQK